MHTRDPSLCFGDRTQRVGRIAALTFVHHYARNFAVGLGDHQHGSFSGRYMSLLPMFLLLLLSQTSQRLYQVFCQRLGVWRFLDYRRPAYRGTTGRADEEFTLGRRWLQILYHIELIRRTQRAVRHRGQRRVIRKVHAESRAG